MLTKVTNYKNGSSLVEIPESVWQGFVVKFGVDRTCHIITEKLLESRPTTLLYHFHIIDQERNIVDAYAIETEEIENA